MSDSDGTFRWQIGHQGHNKKMPEASVKVTISIVVAADAPPALVRAVNEGVVDIFKIACEPEELADLAAELQEIQARKQREADSVARKLLGGEEEETP